MRKFLLAPGAMSAVLLVLALTATSSAQLRIPPVGGKVISEATKAASRDLTGAQKNEVVEFLKFHAKRMVDAEASPEAVKASREALLGAYESGSGEAFGKFFAASASEDFAPVVLESRAAIVLVNGALVLSRLQRSEVLPGLDRMVGHGNPAVRYFGVTAYAGMRDTLLASAADRGALAKMVKARGAVETSPPVLAKLFWTMDFSKVGGADRATRADLQASLLKAVTGHLPAIRNGDPDMATACLAGVEAIRNIGKQARERQDLYTVLAELMANAGEAYKEKQTASLSSDATAKKAADALAFLLLQCENVLVELTGQAEHPVADALKLSEVVLALRVKLAVNQWVGTPQVPGLLNRYNVKPPTVLPLGGAITNPSPGPEPATP